VNKLNKDEAKRTLLKLRGANQIDLINKEINDLENEILNESKQDKKRLGYLDIIKIKHLRRALLVALFLQIAQQLIGADAVYICFYFLVLYQLIYIDLK
jgi:hypothetical protein